MKNLNEEELVDILEGMYVLCNFYKFDKNKLELIRKNKAEKRGRFTNKIILDEIKEKTSFFTLIVRFIIIFFVIIYYIDSKIEIFINFKHNNYYMVRKNLGKRDRFLWFVIGLILLMIAIFKVKLIMFKWLFSFFGGFFILASILGFSVCYYIIGFSSRGVGLNRITKRDIELAIKKDRINIEQTVKINTNKKKNSVKKTEIKVEDNKVSKTKTSKTKKSSKPKKKSNKKSKSETKKSSSTKKNKKTDSTSSKKSKTKSKKSTKKKK